MLSDLSGPINNLLREMRQYGFISEVTWLTSN